jgi:Ca2+-binding RTX toxin-like protein
VVRGLATADTLTGGAGNDVLDGGDGADRMAGGGGNDTYLVEQAGDIVTEAAGAGADTVISYLASYTLGADVENLVLGAGAQTGIGNALDNAITGSSGANTLEGLAGNDVLDGGKGADTMSAGVGDDLYVADNAGDVVIEAAAAGIDTVRASVTLTGALAANVENLVLTGTKAIDGTGNGLANTLTGNAAVNRLDGGAGADTMAGGLGDDVYIVGSAADVVTELAGQGIDGIESAVSLTLGANVENLNLTGAVAKNAFGNGLANVLVGNSAANVLRGAAGADTLTGGADADIFDFNSITESGVGDGLRDIIADFVSGLDQIDFSGIDADLGDPGNDVFVNLGTAAFTGAGQLRYEFDGGNTLIQGNVGGVNGDAADFEVLVLGIHPFPVGTFDYIL